MNKEVICLNCKFFTNNPKFKYPPGKNTGIDVHTVCDCPNNIDRHYAPTDSRKYISCPSIINRNKDCNWFIKKVKYQTFVWTHESRVVPTYKDHGEGTFNVNPKGGLDGFYIGDKTLKESVKENVKETAVEVIEELVPPIVQESLNSIEKIEGGSSINVK